MVAKLITWDVDREYATRRMLRALDEYEIEPLTTLIPFHKAVMASDEWAEASTFREKIADKKWLKKLAPEAPAEARRRRGRGGEDRAHLPGRGQRPAPLGQGDRRGGTRGRRRRRRGAKRPPKREKKAGGGGAASGNDVVAPLQGTMFKVDVEKGQEVEEGAIICVIEAMKMENEITAHKAGKVTALSVAEGQPISSGDPIATIE